MNPKEALKQVHEAEAQEQLIRDQQAQGEDLKDRQRFIEYKLTERLMLPADHRIEYDPDPPASYKFCRRCGQHSRKTGLSRLCFRPYTTDITAAWEIVDYIEALGGTLSLHKPTFPSGMGKTWYAVFTKPDQDGEQFTHYRGEDGSAPMAISLAALQFTVEARNRPKMTDVGRWK